MDQQFLLQTLFHIAIAIVILVLLYGFAILAKGRVIGRATTRFVLLLGSGVTLMCALLWIGSTISVIKIPKNTTTAIWSVLIAGILGTTVSVFRQQLIGARRILTIERLLLLNEANVSIKDGVDVLKSLKQRNNADYKRGQEKILFCAIIGGYSVSASGSIDIQVETMVYDSNELAASLMPKRHYSNPLHWKDKIYARDKASFEAVVGNIAEDKTLVIGMVEKIPSYISDGLVELRITVRDCLTLAVAQGTREICLHNVRT